ncbi:MAG TPA: twin-arginine translocase TatA/TatE family subunit [Acidimicrobiia bacterium]|nr:twin-arginine translocase TatA/TatE family subunit [Acidimicrobiia bacterium]HZQ79723.1 twin-arginine translocase TatA/TatE family subunit [Acidimicrobiia bacterium]
MGTTLFVGEIIGPDILIILAIVMVLFGSAKIPKLARSLGQASHEFRKGLGEGVTDQLLAPPPAPTTPAAVAPPPAPAETVSPVAAEASAAPVEAAKPVEAARPAEPATAAGAAETAEAARVTPGGNGQATG